MVLHAFDQGSREAISACNLINAAKRCLEILLIDDAVAIRICPLEVGGFISVASFVASFAFFDVINVVLDIASNRLAVKGSSIPRASHFENFSKLASVVDGLLGSIHTLDHGLNEILGDDVATGFLDSLHEHLSHLVRAD